MTIQVGSLWEKGLGQRYYWAFVENTFYGERLFSVEEGLGTEVILESGLIE